MVGMKGRVVKCNGSDLKRLLGLPLEDKLYGVKGNYEEKSNNWSRIVEF
jgi:hypothetical protein